MNLAPHKVHRSQFESALAAGETGRALDRLHALWNDEPTAATATFLLRGFERLRPSMPWCADLRLFVLRSFTFEPMVPLLRAEAALHGVALTVELDALGTHAQSILDPSSRLFAADPDVVVLALGLRDVAPELANGFAELEETAVPSVVERALRDLEHLITTFRARSRARLLVHGFELPHPLELGVLDAASRASQQDAVRELQRGLAALCRAHHEVHVVDVEEAFAPLGLERAHDATRWSTMRVPYRAEGWLALARALTRRLVPMTSRAAKCVVVDLDHTLWGGILGEDGEAALQLGIEYPGVAHRALQHTLKLLARRGLMLAIASKNDADETLRVVDTHPDMLLRVSDFAATQVHWRPKSESLRAIASELGIGVDALAFVDDNPVERAEVREALPMVHVVDLGGDPMRYAARVAEHPSLERLRVSAEDRARDALVAADRARDALARRTGSLEDFHRSLEMRVEWRAPTASTLERIAQLTQKTNQFNLTTVRRNVSEIEALDRREDVLVRSLRVRDRFGDNGLVGLVVATLDGETAELDTLLMSCRVIGRTVETAMLAKLGEELRMRGVRTLRARYVPTAKNGPASEFLPRHGFEFLGHDDDGTTRHRIAVERLPAMPPWFVDEAMAGSAP